MLAARSLRIMLRALGYAAVPSWPLMVMAALWWSGRVELAFLAIAGLGTHSALTLLLVRTARERTARYERLMEQREARFERVAGKLCDTLVANLPVPGRVAAKTMPDLRVVR